MGRWAWRSIAAIICLSILVLSAIASGSVLVIRFKDGSSQQYDLSKIEALTFSDSGGAETGVAPIPGRLVWSEEFDQAVSQVWEPIQVVGGNYQAFARVQSGSFIVNVPAGNWWGKTGLMTRNPLFTVDASMQNSPANIVFEFDPQATQGFCLALSQHKNADVWLVPHLWFAYSAHPTSGEAVWSMLNGQGSERAVPTTSEICCKLPSDRKGCR